MDAHPRRRVPRSFRTVALGGAALAVLIVAVAVSLYLRFIRYERVAARHVPPGTVVALRLDVEQVGLYEPVRRHLIPLLGGPARSRADAEATLGRLEERTGLKRADLREIVVARGAVPSDWAIIFGGIFPRSTSGGVLAAALAAEDAAWAPSPDGDAVIHRGLGVAVGRASDGTVLVASSPHALRDAREPSDAYGRIGLSPVGAGSLAMGADGVRELGEWPGVLAHERLAAALSGVEGIRCELSLGERRSVAIRLSDKGHDSGTAAIREGLAIMRGFDRASADPWDALLRAGAERAVVAPPARGTATATLAWETAEVDQAFALVADAIQARWQ
jgi:hypothetical protein